MQAVNDKNQMCFVVWSDEIEGRLDPFPYHPIRINTIKKIKSSKFQLLPLKEIAKITKELVTLKQDNLIYVGLENIESNTGVFIPSDEEKENFSSALKFKKGDILFPKLRPYLNKVHLAEFDGVCSTEFHVLKAKKCNNVYLFCFLNSQLVVNQTSYLMTGNTLPRLQTEEIAKIQIPLPPLEIQNQIVEIMESAYKQKKEKEDEAEKLLNSIDNYVLDELGIKIPEIKDKISFAVDSEDVKNNRLDAYYYQPKFKELEDALGEGKYKPIKIEQRLKILAELEDISKYDSIKYIDLASVDKDFGIINNYKELKSSEAPSRARQKVEQGDLLLSSLQGSLKSVAVIEDNFNNLIVSTGFYVIRKSENYNNYYLWAIFRNLIYQILLNRMATGAIMSAINRKDLENLKIPLPPLEIQNKIAEEVKSRIDKAKKLKEEAQNIVEKAKKEVEEIILG